MLAPPPGELAPPPRGNPRSATEYGQLADSTDAASKRDHPDQDSTAY